MTVWLLVVLARGSIPAARAGASRPGKFLFAEVRDTLALLAWVHKDVLIKRRLDAEVEAESDDAAVLTHEARQQRKAVVMGDLQAVERDEVALVWRGQSEG